LVARDPRREFVERVFAGQDAFQRMQQALAQLVLPPEQRHAINDAFINMMTPGSQFDALIEMTKAFSPPVAQIEGLAKQVGEQRRQLDAMNKELGQIEAAVNRLLAAAEQLVTNQAAFLRLAEAFAPPRGNRRSSATSTKAKDETDTDPDSPTST